ncbi:hypothetical protein [Nocardia brasiliensis]|uniref:hypothetical protein n=1 Tax=Nocardia brasiliensis TaxID=37326 RepID=UPI0033C4601B
MTTLEYESFPLDTVCELTGAPSPDWLSRHLNAGELTGILSGTSWRMTRTDMAGVVAYMRRVAERHVADRAAKRAAQHPESAPASAPTNTAGLSARSAARLRKRAAATP